MLLTSDSIRQYLSMQLGPALKLERVIARLRELLALKTARQRSNQTNAKA